MIGVGAALIDDRDQVGDVFRDHAEVRFALVQFGGARGDGPLEVADVGAHLLRKLPPGRERVGQLHDFDVAEGFLEDHETIGRAQLLDDLVPRVVGEGGANHHLQVGIDLPEPRDGLDAIPARRHLHIDKGQRIRLPLGECGLHAGQSLLPLVRGIDGEGAGSRRTWRCAEKSGASGLLRIDPLAAQDLFDVLVAGSIVVDHTDSVAFEVGSHGLRASFDSRDSAPGSAGSLIRRGRGASGRVGASIGSSRVKAAPQPTPSLCTEKRPPISLAALAALCRPKPWSSFLVMPPWLKMRSRFSRGMPTPVATTVTRTRPLWCGAVPRGARDPEWSLPSPGDRSGAAPRSPARARGSFEWHSWCPMIQPRPCHRQ